MVGTIEARKFNLSLSSTTNSKVITNLFYEPNSTSLALMHFDSSISLISPFSPFSVSTLLPKTLISPFNSSACFVTFKPNPKIVSCPDDKDVKFTNFGTHMNPNSKIENCPDGRDVKFTNFGTYMNPNSKIVDCPDDKDVKFTNFGTHMNPNCKIESCSAREDVIFITAGPYNGGNKVLLKFHVLGKGGNFRCVQVNCSQNGFCFDRKQGGVIVDVSHGMKVMLSGSVNYFAIYSSLMAKLMVFGLKLMGDGSRDLRLVKCAVIECRFPVMSICVSFGFLMLGEMKGIRVFSLRALVKGKVGTRRKSRVARGKFENSNDEKQQEVDVKLEGRKLKVLNGVTQPHYESHELGKSGASVNPSKLLANGFVHNSPGVQSNANADDNRHGAVKLRSLKLRQDSGECGMQFLSFDGSVDEGVKSKEPQNMTTKAISIQAVSQQKFLVLSSNGDLHVLHLPKSGSAQMRRVPGTIQVQQFATFPDTSTNSCVWISDGLYSAHVLTMPCKDTPDNDNSSNSEENISTCSVTQAIFTSESIKDMVAVAGNVILLLGQDCLYAYAIS